MTSPVTIGALIAAGLVWYGVDQYRTHCHQHVHNEIDVEKEKEIKAEEKKKKKSENVYAPDRPLPKDQKHKRPIPDADAKGWHTQLGTREGSEGKYTQAREFKDGKVVKDIDFTDHGYPDKHANPHQHNWVENETGGTYKRDKPQPLEGWDY